MMTTAELNAYNRMPDGERRAKRRELLEEIEHWEAIARSLEEQCAVSVAAGARQDLEAFQRGEHGLMGMPRERVDFPAALAALERAITSG